MTAHVTVRPLTPLEDYGRMPECIRNSKERCHRGALVTSGGRLSFWRCAPEDPRPAAGAIVLLHGLGGTADGLLPLVGALGATHNCYALDLPGHGQSELPSQLQHWGVLSADALADVVAEAIIDVGAGRPVRLVGVSMGGLVAIHLARRHPQVVADLVLVSCAFVQLLKTARTVPGLLAKPAVLGGLIAQTLAGAVPLPSVLIGALAERPELFRRFATHPERLDAEVRRAALRRHSTLWTNVRTLPNSLSYDFAAHVRALDVGRIRLVVGDADQLSPLQDAENLATWNDVELCVIEGCGHWLVAEQPLTLATEIGRSSAAPDPSQ